MGHENISRHFYKKNTKGVIFVDVNLRQGSSNILNSGLLNDKDKTTQNLRLHPLTFCLPYPILPFLEIYDIELTRIERNCTESIEDFSDSQYKSCSTVAPTFKAQRKHDGYGPP